MLRFRHPSLNPLTASSELVSPPWSGAGQFRGGVGIPCQERTASVAVVSALWCVLSKVGQSASESVVESGVSPFRSCAQWRNRSVMARSYPSVVGS